MSSYSVFAQDPDGKEVSIRTGDRLRALFHAEIFQAKSRYSQVRIEHGGKQYLPEQWSVLP